MLLGKSISSVIGNSRNGSFQKEAWGTFTFQAFLKSFYKTKIIHVISDLNPP